MREFKHSNYTPANGDDWIGRDDGVDRASLRWHHVIEPIDLRTNQTSEDSLVFLGFCCDEGVRRNQGREGAKDAPVIFRQILSNLPVHFSSAVSLKDAGNIHCDNGDLEDAQFVLSEAVAKILENGSFPIVLGGGHEVTYGHFQGLQKAVPGKKIGIINIDAHLDIRPMVEGKANSGTGFYQIAEDYKAKNEILNYLALGIQEISNTKSLFDYAQGNRVQIIYANEFDQRKVDHIKECIDTFSKNVEHVYLTIDMDAFAAAYAPGVSALSFNGIVPDRSFFEIFEHILRLPNLSTVDLAELNPRFDIDNRTARLGASLLYDLISKKANKFPY